MRESAVRGRGRESERESEGESEREREREGACAIGAIEEGEVEDERLGQHHLPREIDIGSIDLSDNVQSSRPATLTTASQKCEAVPRRVRI
jgi:hypothetical protein